MSAITRDMVVVYVATAGIGRLGFKAWLKDTEIDRQDGDDGGTYMTPGEALAALGREIDERLVAQAWCAHDGELVIGTPQRCLPVDDSPAVRKRGNRRTR